MEFEVTKRSVKVFIDGKHRKTFPLYLESFVETGLLEATFLKMEKSTTLKLSDQEIIKSKVFDFLYQYLFGNLLKYEHHVHDVIKNANPVGCRIVYPLQGFKRYELVFDNKISVKCDEKLYYWSYKLPDAYLNY